MDQSQHAHSRRAGISHWAKAEKPSLPPSAQLAGLTPGQAAATSNPQIAWPLVPGTARCCSPNSQQNLSARTCCHGNCPEVKICSNPAGFCSQSTRAAGCVAAAATPEKTMVVASTAEHSWVGARGDVFDKGASALGMGSRSVSRVD